MAAVSLTLLGMMLLVCFGYGLISPFTLEKMDMHNRFALPGGSHLLGTDNFGRDLATRLAAGGRISLLIASAVVFCSATLGTGIGLIAGYRGGWVDALLMNVVDVFLAFPAFVLAISVVAALGPGEV